MPERSVMINVTPEFRAKIKELKRELTYQEYFDNLLKISEGKSPQSKVPQMTNLKETW